MLNRDDRDDLDGPAPSDTGYPQVAEDLRTLSGARNYHAWVFSTIEGALGGRIVEVGPGIGNYTPLLLGHGQVLALEADRAYLPVLRRRFGARQEFTVEELSLGNWSAATRASVRRFHPDTFVCLNVLEHVEDDEAAVASMYDCLEPGGHIALVVPAHQWLFSPLDERYGHHRRYTTSDVQRLVAGLPGATVPRCHYFNAAAVPGWWVNNVVFKRQRLSKAQTLLFDRMLVPVAAAVERRVRVPFGLSLVVWIGRNG